MLYTRALKLDKGWFPSDCIRETLPEEFKKVQHLLGDASEDALAVPATWDDVPQGERFQAHRFELKEGEEKRVVELAFQQSLKKARIPITVVGVERVQNYASIQSTTRSYQACARVLVCGYWCQWWWWWWWCVGGAGAV